MLAADAWSWVRRQAADPEGQVLLALAGLVTLTVGWVCFWPVPTEVVGRGVKVGSVASGPEVQPTDHVGGQHPVTNPCQRPLAPHGQWPVESVDLQAAEGGLGWCCPFRATGVRSA